MSNTSEYIAQEREFLANKLSESQIHHSVVENVINMNVNTEMKVGILLQSIPDLAVIYRNLQSAHSIGNLPSKEYRNLLEHLLDVIQTRAHRVEYDPRKSMRF